jgi:DNA (cytosine-5)-methyltransferase 1
MAKDGYRYIYPHSDQPRTLSVREAARIQSFPDHFRFAGYRTSRSRQIGNAVPPLLAEAIARSLARAIREHRQWEQKEYEWHPLFPDLQEALIVP